jgi:hypothetical protein
MGASVIVDDFHVIRIPVVPAKTDSPLIINPNAVLADAGAFKLFESIARRHSQFCEPLSGIDNAELAEHGALQLGWVSTDGLSLEEPFGIAIAEAVDHME